jgi:CheY-like chemotaxis protein
MGPASSSSYRSSISPYSGPPLTFGKTMKQTLLFAENEATARDTWATVLSRAGFDVRRAANPQQARDILHSGEIDLAVLDLRLVDDDDPADFSGLEVATDRAFRHIPKILLTAYPVSYEQLRRAVGPAIDDLPSAVAFVDKSEGAEALLVVIRQAFEAWPRLRLSASRVSDQIKVDHSVARRQAHVSYSVAFTFLSLAFW